MGSARPSGEHAAETSIDRFGCSCVFAVGCKTGTVPGFSKLLTRNAVAVLFSRSLMATEGYSTLALANGLTRALDSKEMVGLADRTYRYFQKLAKPDRRVGSAFVSHGYRLFE